MFLRKKLNNAVLLSIDQINKDRIVRLKFKTQNKYLNLYAELFNKGNFILTDENNSIIGYEYNQKLKNREIKKGSRYVCDVPPLKFSDIVNKDEDIVKVFARDLKIGRVYAEELCIGIDKHKHISDFSKEELAKLEENFNKLYTRKTEPCAVFESEYAAALAENRIIDIVPFPLKIYEKYNKKSFSTYNSAFNEIISYIEKHEQEIKINKRFQKEIEKYENIINQQKKYLEEIEKKIELNHKIGDLIYENYEKIKNILNDARMKKDIKVKKRKATKIIIEL